MAFRIEFVDDYDTAAGYLWHNGRMVLGGEEEPFRALIHDWSEPEYERQWRDALGAIAAGEPYSFLLTVMSPAGSREMYVLWPLARDGDEVRMRNTFYPPGPFPDFDPSDDFDGQASEWYFSVRDVETFLRENGV